MTTHILKAMSCIHRNDHPPLPLPSPSSPPLLPQIFAVEHPAEVAFFGFARPAFGSIPPTVEMQARYYSLVINGVSNPASIVHPIQSSLGSQ